VTIVRERHPFEGRTLAVMSAIKRRGTPLLLVVLPDGSRSLIPASWTDWAGTVDDSSSPSEHRDPRLASLTDLLHVRGIVDALLGRCLIPPQMPAADEESSDATELGLSRPPTPTASPPSRELRDAKARAEALDILTRLIAKAAQPANQTEATDE
jgi:hypothetical protein